MMEDFNCITGSREYVESQRVKLGANGYICDITQIGSGDWYSVRFWRKNND